jgi:hypothetical protein
MVELLRAVILCGIFSFLLYYISHLWAQWSNPAYAGEEPRFPLPGLLVMSFMWVLGFIACLVAVGNIYFGYY